MRKLLTATTIFLLGCGGVSLAYAQDAATPSPSTDMVISGGIICSTQDELTKMLDGIEAGQVALVEGCGQLTNTAHVQATLVGEYHNGDIQGFIYKYETPANGDVEYGIRHDTVPAGPTA